MNALEKLVLRLDNIAVLNGDEFRCFVTVRPGRGGFRYFFECEETADGHTVLAGTGLTLEAAVADAENGIGDACAEWGYEEPLDKSAAV